MDSHPVQEFNITANKFFKTSISSSAFTPKESSDIPIGPVQKRSKTAGGPQRNQTNSPLRQCSISLESLAFKPPTRFIYQAKFACFTVGAVQINLKESLWVCCEKHGLKSSVNLTNFFSNYFEKCLKFGRKRTKR